MDSEPRSDVPAGPLPRQFVPVIVVAVLAALGVTAAWSLWRASAAPGARRVARSGSVAARGPGDEVARYANARPGVRYVGDAACARCHAEIAAAYRQHPMGRSLMPIAAVPGSKGGGPDDLGSFRAQGFEYAVERRGDRLVHKEVRRDARGRTLTEVEGEVRYVIGSGSRAFSYVIEREGYLFESPITWYAQARRWDLSPGYEVKDQKHLERPIDVACLFCHTNRVDYVEGTLNHYRQPIFEGYAIGCERCHGPGELHARQPLAPPDAPRNIVNPADLEPALREAVCQQCHLQGDVRVARAGRTLRDYRPGLPLHDFVSVFVKAATTGRERFFGQVEQMYESRCFRGSGGALGCTSCHDPHRQPAPAEKVAYYRDRCLECHAERGCRLPRAERLGRDAADSCIACHMPRSPSPEVRHTATTIHYIPRFADRHEPARDSAGATGSLVHFHHDLLPPEERGEVARELGLVLALGARRLPGRSAAESCLRALPLLESALAARPDDVPAWYAKGDALRTLGRRAEALAAFQAVLKLAPSDESTLVAAAALMTETGRRGEARDFWRRVLAIDPWRSDYHHGLGLVHFQLQDWPAAAEACRAALRLNPADLDVRMLLVDCCLKMGRKAEARDEFQVVLGYDPPDRDARVRWFASQQ